MSRRTSSPRRTISAILIALVIAFCFLNPLSQSSKFRISRRSQCDASEHCIASESDNSGIDGLPLSAAFASLKTEADGLKQNFEQLKVQGQNTVTENLLPKQSLWESRRTECGEGVQRN